VVKFFYNFNEKFRFLDYVCLVDVILKARILRSEVREPRFIWKLIVAYVHQTRRMIDIVRDCTAVLLVV
jgi:hypothetical protein